MNDHVPAGFVDLGDGRLVLHDTPATLCRWFDGQFLRLARDEGAAEYQFPSVIARLVLERAGFFEAFPNGATGVGDGPPAMHMLSPAVCYHAYARLADQTLPGSVALTASGRCFREVDREGPAPDRLWEFTMREVVFVGGADRVARQRDTWAGRINEFARVLGLTGRLEVATDPFFGPLSRGQRLLQQVKQLKFELRLDTSEGPLAVASFNLHDTVFGERFGISLSDGRPAHSACVAFGLERWALAYVRQKGEQAAMDLIAA